MRERVRVPQIQHADEIGVGIDELRVRCVSGGARIRRTLARVLDAQESDQNQQLAGDA